MSYWSWFIIRVMHSMVLIVGALWLVACIALPALLIPPTWAAAAVVPLPVAPIRRPVETLWLRPQIVAYSSHLLAENETLSDVALRGGSDPLLIKSYNRLAGTPQSGYPLIVPHLVGYANTLVSEPILVVRGHTERPRVALTLDAGASSEPTPYMLQVLRERHINITFFLTGTWIQQNPDLARQMVTDGHEIANHSLTHPDFTLLSDEEIIAELNATERLMLETTGGTTRPFFRPPFGAYDERVLQVVAGQGYLPIYWTLDSLDSVGEPKTPAFLLERITTALSPTELYGAIILAHCGSAATAEALPAILDRFAAMGLEVRPLSEVLASDVERNMLLYAENTHH